MNAITSLADKLTSGLQIFMKLSPIFVYNFEADIVSRLHFSSCDVFNTLYLIRNTLYLIRSPR